MPEIPIMRCSNAWQPCAVGGVSGGFTIFFHLYKGIFQELPSLYRSVPSKGGMVGLRFMGRRPPCVPPVWKYAHMGGKGGMVSVAGITISAFYPEMAGYGLNPASADRNSKCRTKDYLLRAIDCCVAVGTRRILLYPGAALEDEDRDQRCGGRRNFISRFSRKWRRQGLRLF